ncbi:hypothetical protein CDL12_25807 [Handroanthus impetiginosus]|uniref:Bifunctional inhibitor/plant lipid transfer protein/seed storage helical domain-containing protein n=1 Tax=Handroanthus impetiginosus TaxID=429701 RepID=A0A2G9G8T8_9LAMI|nr:hypothetical protein CDL12_25807 [Handroanthus impetiginosus]
MIRSFSPCISFLASGSNISSPSSGCCNSLRDLMSNGQDCLCLFVTGGVPLQVPINQSLAISLPRACRMSGVPVECKATASPVPAPDPGNSGQNGPGLSPPSFGVPFLPRPLTPPSPPESGLTPPNGGLTPPDGDLVPTLTPPGMRPTLNPSAAVQSHSVFPSLLVVVLGKNKTQKCIEYAYILSRKSHLTHIIAYVTRRNETAIPLVSFGCNICGFYLVINRKFPAVQAGYYCLCSLIGPSNYPVFSTELAVSFSNCYISMPPLTHCPGLEPNPVVTAPPVAALPRLNQPPPLPPSPLLPVLMPPDFPRDDTVVPLPPKVNEMPLNSRGDNSSTVDSNPTFSGSPQPKQGIPERWNHLSSDGGNVKMLLYSRNLLILALFSYSIA